MRAFDEDIKEMKEVTDELQKNDEEEGGGKLTVVDDLVEKDGNYIIPKEGQDEGMLDMLIPEWLKKLIKTSERKMRAINDYLLEQQKKKQEKNQN